MTRGSRQWSGVWPRPREGARKYAPAWPSDLRPWRPAEVITGVRILRRRVRPREGVEDRDRVVRVEPGLMAVGKAPVHVALSVVHIAIKAIALHIALVRSGRVGVPPNESSVVTLVVVIPLPELVPEGNHRVCYSC